MPAHWRQTTGMSGLTPKKMRRVSSLFPLLRISQLPAELAEDARAAMGQAVGAGPTTGAIPQRDARPNAEGDDRRGADDVEAC